MERIFLKYILCLLCVYTITACDKVNDEVPDQPKFTPHVSESYWSVKTEVYVDAPFNAEKIKKELEDNPPALPSDVYYFYMRKLSSALSAERTVSLLNSARDFVSIRERAIYHTMEMGNRKTIRLWSKDIFFIWRRSIAKRRPS